ncbi:MAG: hypothetical protein KAI64_01330 [Thermoplasmata archaeon]|nr:hypothetical protein [Thermoplasmata archaeon]
MSCDCKPSGKPVQYKCSTDEKCCIIEFDDEPNAKPYCCGEPMKRIK